MKQRISRMSSNTKESNSSSTSYQQMNPDSRIIQIEDGTCDAGGSHSPTSLLCSMQAGLPRPGSSDGTMSIDAPPPTFTESFKSYITNPYLAIELAVCVLVGALGHFAPGYVFRLPLNERDIPYQITANGDVILDQYINRPLVEKETIPDWLLLVLSFVSPLIIVVVSGAMSPIRNDLHAATCTLFFAMGSTEFITSFVKLYAGYLRPNFYSYCGFSEDIMACESDSNDPRKSFPSGHAASSFCSMTLLTLLFFGKIGLHRGLWSSGGNGVTGEASRGPAYYIKKRILSMFAAMPMFLAVFIAASRVHDNMHHPADITAGAIIGIFCAVFGYGLWYPSIYSSFAGFPLQTSFEIMAMH